MDYEDLFSELKEIIQSSKYGDFCFRDINNVLSKYMEEHTLTISELGDIYYWISVFIKNETAYDLENWEDWNEEDE